jgi:phosphohistidine phosphatase SixA
MHHEAGAACGLESAPNSMTSRRSIILALAVAGPVLLGEAGALAAEEAAWSAIKDGTTVLFRHATAPGVGDPQGMRLDDCATQRNLDNRGRAEARRIGAAFRERKIAAGAVLTSQWCRARETAELAFPGRAQVETAFNSFFDDAAAEPAQTAAARRILSRWKGPDVLVVTTHQVNIGALTGIRPASGEGIVVEWRDDGLKVLGRIKP